MLGHPAEINYGRILRNLIPFSKVLLGAVLLLPAAIPFQTSAESITNLQQLINVLDVEPRVIGDVRLQVTICAASRPEIGVVVAQDETSVDLLELGPLSQAILPGDRIEIQQQGCLLRRRDFGVKLSVAPVVDNDGIHGPATQPGEVMLTAGRHSLEVDWFNQFLGSVLEVNCGPSNTASQKSSDAALRLTTSDESSGRIVLRSGLQVECYEGYWDDVPDFELLRPVKTGVATNFDLRFRTRDESVGLRFKGYFDAPNTGIYAFSTRSDDGSLLFVGEPEVKFRKLGVATFPLPQASIIGGAMTNLDERGLMSVVGRVDAASPTGKGLELELRSERDSLQVRIVDSAGLDPAALLNARVRVTGVGRGFFNLDHRIVLGQLAVASAKEFELLEKPTGVSPTSFPLSTIRQVQTLKLEDARRNLPVRISGVVTSHGRRYDYWLSLQDDTRGIFVDTHALSNAVPACGEYWQIIGHSGAGNFAPIVVADQAICLGEGRLPEATRPGWNELINGSMDAQWVEFQGLVTAIHGNMLSLFFPGGQIAVQLRGHYESDLKHFEHAVVHIRGVLFAAWNTGTRELRVGTIQMDNASVNVDVPAPADPFDAVAKTPRELLLFDARPTPFRRVKVVGQIVYSDPSRIFLVDDGTGLPILPDGVVSVRPGDLVEAVGYPEISETSTVLREAIVRKTGEAALPAPRILTENELAMDGLDATRVRVEGKLLGWHLERGLPVLEMMSGGHLYLARLASGKNTDLPLRLGSRLALEGVYVGPGARRNQYPETKSESFEMLLNSPDDILVISQPTWWTLQRLIIVVGILLVILVFTTIWITQLRRQVEQRTAQLQHATREREHVERKHALEAERSRIARDLHDDLGSSLTEIGTLASIGLRRKETPAFTHAEGHSFGKEPSYSNLFQTIAGKARGLIAALDVIVWAVDPEDNSLQSLTDYLSGYAEEFFSHTNIACRFRVPVSTPPVTLEGQVRHDLLMAVKETLNNVVRHADATEVEFKIEISGNNLGIEITDNGKGISCSSENPGHGLKNLSGRMSKLGGEYALESRPGGGTVVKIFLPLPAPRELEAVEG